MSLFSFAYKFLQEIKLTSDQYNKILLDTANGEIILDQRIQAKDGSMAWVNLIYESIHKKILW